MDTQLQTWMDIKKQQIEMYLKRAKVHSIRRNMLRVLHILVGIFSVLMFLVFVSVEQGLIALAVLILIPVSMLIWKFSTYENRASQLLNQLAQEVDNAIVRDMQQQISLDVMKKNVTTIETRFLSNDDELFVKKAVWGSFMTWKEAKRDEELRYMADPHSNKQFIPVPPITLGPVWNTDIPHRQGYEDSNTLEDEWAIIKALRLLISTNYTAIFHVLDATSAVAKRNPVVFERYLRKKKISKKMKKFKRRAGVHYLSAAAKMRLVTFVDGVLALEPTDLNEATVTLLHEKNEQIKKYTDEFWQVHRRSIKFYWFEAVWLLLLIPFIAGAANLISAGAETEGIILFTVVPL